MPISAAAHSSPSTARDAEATLLAAGNLRVRLLPEAGGRIAAFFIDASRSGRRDILPPIASLYPDPLVWPKAGCYPLVPFSNRIREARFPHAGGEVRLAAHPSCPPHALHGFAQTAPWRLISGTGEEALMRYEHAPGDWPFAFRAEQRLRLDAGGVSVALAVTNTSRDAMPVGLGLHPYFCAAPGDRVRFEAGAEWDQDEAGCGLLARPRAGAAAIHDAPLTGEPQTRYFSGWTGTARLECADRVSVMVEAGPPLDHFVFHVPPGGAYACLEPVSHVADAFNLAARGVAGTGFRTIAPGEVLVAEIRIEVTDGRA